LLVLWKGNDLLSAYAFNLGLSVFSKWCFAWERTASWHF